MRWSQYTRIVKTDRSFLGPIDQGNIPSKLVNADSLLADVVQAIYNGVVGKRGAVAARSAAKALSLNCMAI
jgi:hypothetical protein